jgi:TatD DNase family protein
MNLFDSHCHLDDPAYKNDLDAMLERARTAGVSHMMTIGVTLETSRRGVELAKTQPGVYASVGVHPHDSRECSDAVVDELIRLSQDRRSAPGARPAWTSTACTRPATTRKSGL